MRAPTALGVAILSVIAAFLVPSAAVAQQPAAAPPGIDIAALGHDSHSDVYRSPTGTVPVGAAVRLRFRSASDDLTSVFVRLTDESSAQQRIPMRRVAHDVDCYDRAPAGTRCDFWQATVTPRRLGTVSYRFVARKDAHIVYYADQPALFGGMGTATDTDVPDNYRIHAVKQDFRAPESMGNGLIYQIFPDRFANGDPSNSPPTTAPRYDYPAPPGATDEQKAAAAKAQITHRSWNQYPEGHCRDYVDTPCSEEALGRDYFGGDLQGVTAKLGYLDRLGVTMLYLNPVFSSASDHAYDVRDFRHIDPAFGGDAALRALLKKAHARKMQVILDLPYDPTSSDSPYFDRYHHFGTVGACESPDSPYRSWFGFRDLPAGQDGPCAGSSGDLRANYDSWGGTADALPLLRKSDPNHPDQPYSPVAQAFYRGAHSITAHWLDFGVDGFRLDSMQDASFPKSYWQQFRRAVKAQKPGAPLIAEAWHYNDNMPLTNGDTADTPMGYRFRAAVLSLLGATGDDKGFPGENDPNVPVSQFAEAMESIRQDYPDATYRTFMNLLGTHDTGRLRWMLTPGANNPADREDNPQNVAVGLAKERVAATLQFTLPGMPSVYYGDEVGVTGSDDPDNRRTFPWSANGGAGGDQDLLGLYRSLSRMREHDAVFRDGDVTFLTGDDNAQTLAYSSRTADDVVLVVVNRSAEQSRTITIPTAGVLRNGVRLTDALRPGRHLRTAGGSVTTTLAPMTAAVFTAAPGQDLAAPAAPIRLRARDTRAGSAALSWNPVAGAARYAIYRSPLHGGGYRKIGETTRTSTVDDTARFGEPAYYVVRAVDAAGNVGADSVQSAVTPSVPVAAARITSPPRESARVSLAGVTVTAEASASGMGRVTAQVGYRADSGWTWSGMTGNYTGTIRPDHPGTYRILTRFSTDGGVHWTYAGTAGVGTDHPAVLHLTADPDTTPPKPPGATIDWSASTLTVGWPNDPGAAQYRVYRADSAAGAYTKVATVTGRSYVDPDVSPGETHYYRVSAVDSALNVSALSPAVGHRVEPKIVKVTFRVAVPADTPAGQTVYVAGATTNLPPGTPDPLCLWCGGNADTAMHAVGSGVWEATFGIPEGAGIQWKYTRGNWDTVEVRAQNRSGQVGHDAAQLIDDTGPGEAVTAWQDLQ